MPRLQEHSIQENREPIICADSFEMSVQASRTHYCTPRVNGIKIFYIAVEVGFPQKNSTYCAESLLKPYEDGENSQVYAYVPAFVIHLILQKHRGMIGGSLPNLNLQDSYDGAGCEYDEHLVYLDEHVCEHGNSRASGCSDCDNKEYSSRTHNGS